MARGGYREQGSDQAVRLIFRPSLGPWDVTLAVVAALLAAVVALGLIDRYRGFPLDPLDPVPLPLDPLDLAPLVLVVLAPLALIGLRRHVHEIEVGPATVRLRSRHFPLFWSEHRLPRTAIAGVERDADREGRLQLTLRMARGSAIPLLMGYRIDADTASRLSETLTQALDPDQIEALADQHRPVAGRVG
ncbi:MAG: hypothetical protein EOO75_07900 [Myxococcales bacterium]|nr:MAG: hypothetical protein EOO75_07900 [Myxococcales bacterium]